MDIICLVNLTAILYINIQLRAGVVREGEKFTYYMYSLSILGGCEGMNPLEYAASVLHAPIS